MVSQTRTKRTAWSWSWSLVLVQRASEPGYSGGNKTTHISRRKPPEAVYVEANGPAVGNLSCIANKALCGALSGMRRFFRRSLNVALAAPDPHTMRKLS